MQTLKIHEKKSLFFPHIVVVVVKFCVTLSSNWKVYSWHHFINKKKFVKSIFSNNRFDRHLKKKSFIFTSAQIFLAYVDML